jgi:UDP-apiose/xylose synthase
MAGLADLNWTVVRPFNFVGPFMDFMPGVDGDGIPRVLANFSTALVRGETFKLVNGGLAKRCFTSVHDAIDFIFCLFAHADAGVGQAFNVGNADNEVSIAELACLMRSIFASIKDVPESDVPGVEVVSGEDYYGKGYDDSLRRLPSVAKAESLLGFKAKIPLQAALKESLSWFVGHYAL